MLIFIPLGNIRKTQILYVFWEHKGNIDPKWLKNCNIGKSGTISFEFYASDASSSIAKQNDCKNQGFVRKKDGNRADLCFCSILFSFESDHF